MSSPVRLTFGAIHNHDRTGPLLDGAVAIEGVELTGRRHGPVDLFRLIAEGVPYDVAEMSASTYIAMRARGDDRYVALPVFPSRSFRHGSIVVRADSGIAEAGDLAGKRIGMSEYIMTAALWLRGMLHDDYGVSARDVEWSEGGLNEYEPPRVTFDMPGWLRLERIPDDTTLNQLLLDGRLDALMDARLPAAFVEGSRLVRRLFPDYRAAEEAYLARTGHFPIMHLVVLRTELSRRHPWLAGRLYRAFETVRKAGIARLWDTGSLAAALPWLYQELERTAGVFGTGRGGDGFWPYGIEANRATLEYMVEQSVVQGLSPRHPSLDELFVPV